MSRKEFGDLCKGCLCAICTYRNHCEVWVNCDKCKGKDRRIVSCSKFEQEATERDDLISRKILIEELQSLEISITGVHEKGKFREAVREVMSSVLRIVDEQPIAYDKEKAIEELRDAADLNIEDGLWHVELKDALDIVERDWMSKGIIVVDKIPQTCQHIRGNKEEGCPFGGMVCQITQNDVYTHVRDGSKPDWCPIRPMPEKKEVCGRYPQPDVVTASSKVGWNAYRDEILKGGDTE